MWKFKKNFGFKDLESNDYFSCFDKKLWEITRILSSSPTRRFQDGQNAFCLKTKSISRRKYPSRDL